MSELLRSFAAGWRPAGAVTLLAVLLWGCGQAAPRLTSPDPVASVGSLGEIPEDARVSNGGPDPRTPSYWISWSSCGEGSQADVARQNGGRDAGWVLVDDFIADPGLVLGDHPIATCDEAVTVLSGAAGVLAPNDVDELARQVLTTELNLSAGAESCEAVEKVVQVAQLLLSSLGYGGEPAGSPDARERSLASEMGSALAEYNVGTLCR